ncbi:GlsB/YeaQ/YmgE family stress response membrane protein [Luteimonas sp. gir]|uniref:GlsB/YeaQ/YmgE family stress response membrane protein n=1 Tax=unclassified Luteimonas TaxID=2629088 RepID=UPI003075BCBD
MEPTSFWSWVFYLFVGGIAGWLASLLMRSRGQGIVLNVVVGIVGGFIGGWLLPRIGLNVGGGWLGFLVTAFLGAVILLAIVNLFRR